MSYCVNVHYMTIGNLRYRVHKTNMFIVRMRSVKSFIKLQMQNEHSFYKLIALTSKDTTRCR